MKKNIHIVGIALILTIFSIIGLSGCQKAETPEENRYSAEFLQLFNTMSKIIGYAPSKEDFQKQSDFLYQRLEFYHQQYNSFESFEGVNNIKTINEMAGKEPVVVDPSVIELLEFCKEGYEITGGRVNVAMGSVLQIWHRYRDQYMYDEASAKLPSMDELEEAAKHTDINSIIIDKKASTVFLADPKVQLDVGAIAKGYGVQKVVEEARKFGIQRLVLSIGGNVATIGTKPGGEKWSVGVQNPDLTSDEEITPSLKLQDLSLVSSGDYERYYVVDGERYAHIIDPKTLMPPRQFRQVSVVVEDSGYGDLYSTALFIMSLEEGMAFIENTDARAMWVLSDKTTAYSPGFHDLEKP